MEAPKPALSGCCLLPRGDMRWGCPYDPPQGGFFMPPRMNVERRTMLYLWVMIGSALGGGARYWCSGFAARNFGETFPWGTIIVNVVGSFIIGFFATLTGPDGRVMAST